MVGANEAVMRGDLLAQPVAPAGGGRGGLRQGAEFLRPGRQSVGLAEGVIRYPVAPEIDLIGLPRQEGAAAEEPAIAVSSRPRQDNLALAGREDGCEIPPIGCADGERVELGRGDDVVGEEAIFRNAARPTRGIEPEESNEAARRCRQGAGWHPGDGDAGIQAVVLLQSLQSQIERGCRAGKERLAPDSQGPAMQ